MNETGTDQVPETPVEPERPSRVHRRSLFFPLLLVALGIIFLLRNTGALSGNAWDTLVNLWPVLLIILGVDSLYRREGVAGAVFWIGLGIIFLLGNLGVFAYNSWQVIFALWPILLIAIGLDIAIGRRSTLGAVVAMGITIAILAGSLLFLGAGTTTGQTLPGDQISQPAQGATQAQEQIQPATGSLRIAAFSSGEDPQNLIEGQLRKYRGETVRSEYSVDGTTGNYRLYSSGISFVYVPNGSQGWGWDLAMNPAIPVDLQVSIGAGDAILDLSELKINGLKVSMGVGQTTVTLPAEGSFNGDLSGAIGELVVVVPSGAAVRIETTPALGATDAAPGFEKTDHVYTTPGYSSAANKIDLKVSLAIGKITIKMGK
jgi:hypothetical protein